MDESSFFGTLGRLAGRERENQFSRMFLACFEHSRYFRSCILDLLKITCRISGSLPGPDQWICAVEVPTPIPGGGRLDIRISSAVNGFHIVFYLESKLKSTLTFEQLHRYRKHGVEYLVAVTKNEPEVTSDKIKAAGIFVLRWQDVRKALLHHRLSNQIDRFIAHSMVKYMEELGMAYRENITLADLQRCRRVLNTVSSSKYKVIFPRNGFEVADACLHFLNDVRRRFLECNPRLDKLTRWGPGYFVMNDDAGRRFHAFGWDIFKIGNYPKDNFGCRLWLPENERSPLCWAIQRSGSAVTKKYEEFSLKTTLSKGFLDQAKFVQSLTKYAKRWGVT